MRAVLNADTRKASFSVSAYMLELYQDDLCDLLRPADARKGQPEVQPASIPLTPCMGDMCKTCVMIKAMPLESWQSAMSGSFVASGWSAVCSSALIQFLTFAPRRLDAKRQARVVSHVSVRLPFETSNAGDSPAPQAPKQPKLEIKKDAKGMVTVPGAAVVEVTSAKQLWAAIEAGQKNRHVAATQVTACSERLCSMLWFLQHLAELPHPAGSSCATFDSVHGCSHDAPTMLRVFMMRRSGGRTDGGHCALPRR